MSEELLEQLAAPQLPIGRIHIPEDRIREGERPEIGRMADRLKNEGQLVPILVRLPNEDDETDCPVVLEDGERRLLGAKRIYEEDEEIPGVKPGHIKLVIAEGDGSAGVMNRVREFFANEEREDFSWREKALAIREIHDSFIEMMPEWNVESTGGAIKMSTSQVWRYLELTEDPELLENERVANASTLSTARKQLKIAKDHKRRKRHAEYRAKKKAKQKREIEEAKEKGEPVPEVEELDYETLTHRVAKKERAENWISEIEDEYFDWFHWDPPFGGKQRGGAFATRKKIVDTRRYAEDLMRGVIPEIWRTLKDGAWLAIWFHPKTKEWLETYLRGHELDQNEYRCIHCDKPWDFGNLANPCPQNTTWSFWVNPYFYTWYKRNRKADGHEITRFSTNAQEHFFLACKSVRNPAVLVDSSSQNVLVHDMVPRSQRRHVMHKPAGLLEDIISMISVPGSLGGDCGYGSGSIFEAAFQSSRNAIGCDSLEEAWLETTGFLPEFFAQLGLRSVSF